MTVGGPWFIGFLLSDPGCQRYLAVMSGGFFVFLVFAWTCLSAGGWYAEDEYELEALSEPYRILRYSLYGEMRAWQGSLEFFRGGTCVGQVHDGVIELIWRGDKSDRVAEFSYGDGSRIKFSCGPIGWQEAMKIKTLAMRCVGRHSYG